MKSVIARVWSLLIDSDGVVGGGKMTSSVIAPFIPCFAAIPPLLVASGNTIVWSLMTRTVRLFVTHIYHPFTTLPPPFSYPNTRFSLTSASIRKKPIDRAIAGKAPPFHENPTHIPKILGISPVRKTLLTGSNHFRNWPLFPLEYYFPLLGVSGNTIVCCQIYPPFTTLPHPFTIPTPAFCSI